MSMKLPLILLVLACRVFALAADPDPEPKPEPPKPETDKPPVVATTAPESDEAKTPVPAKAPAGVEPKKRSIAEITKNCQVHEGLFRVYAHPETGAVYLYVRKDQLQKEFLYFTQVSDGVVSAGRNRGQFDDQQVFVVSRRFERLEFTTQNTAYYFDPEHPLARAAKANVGNALVASEPVMASDKDGHLINAANLFLKETFMQVKHTPANDAKSVLGKLSETKTKFTAWGSFPRNTFFNVEYIFENPSPPSRPDDGSKLLRELADPRYVSIRVQHTFVAVPENDFRPRQDDPRVGYFMTHLTDQTSTEATPWRDFIHRWNLKKKNPGAALSEPVEPIVWWIENTTPHEFRETIKNAALLWNKSFEKIGFKNALVVNQQPDDAEWNADDIDHNVLRWTSSPKPPFGGYGPHFVNPRTGQIIGADIMLEFGFVKGRIMARRLWDEVGLAGLSQGNDDGVFGSHACASAAILQQGLLYGTGMMRLRKADQVDFDTMLKESMTQLILHELGHTLGLTHNFRASHLHTTTALQDRALTERAGLSGSVMDYMPLNLAPDKKRQGQYYINAPGPYDDWAIEYGYSEALPDAAAEAKRLAAIAGRSNERELAYANDADDMRTAGKAIDPRAQVFDMSSDPIAYGIQRCEMTRKAMSKLLKEFPTEGKSWQDLTQAYISLTTESGNALTAISRYIGGVYVERAFVGQTGAAAPDPLRAVEPEKQKAALAALASHAFSPEAWKADEVLLRHLQQQRRGFDFRSEGEDPKLHERALKFQRALLDHLLHPSTQNRILDSALYGNKYPLGEMMRDLTNAIVSWQELLQPVNTMRQGLQLEYADRLLGIVKSKSHLPAAQSVALHELRNLEESFKSAGSSAPEPNRPHIAHVLYKIGKGLDEKPAN